MTAKLKKEEFCISCESLILGERDRFGPICPGCYKKTRRRDPLMRGAVQRRLVTIVPVMCPHDENCKYERTMHFSVIVFNAKLDPIRVDGPFPKRVAEQEAKRIQEQIDRRRGGGSGRGGKSR